MTGAAYGAAYYVAINSLALPIYFNDPLPWQLGASTVLPSLIGHVIFGAVYDEGMGEEIRVTVVATGLGQAQSRRQSFEVINTPVVQATGTDGGFVHASQGIDYSQLDVPAVVRKGRSTTVEALANSGVDRYDIPAFLRKQAD